MKKGNDTTSTSMDFSSASAIIGGLDSFLEEGVSFNTAPDQQQGGKPAMDISSLMGGGNDDDEDEEEIIDNDGDGEGEGDQGNDGEGDEGNDGDGNGDEGAGQGTDPKKKQKQQSSSTEGLDYKSIINSLVSNKIFEGFDTIETEDGEIPFDEYDVDEESFVEIIKTKIDEVKEQTNSNSTKGLSDFTKHLLEIEKNGGNISQALQTYQAYQNPLDSFDLEDEIDQQKVIFMKYHNVMGMEKEVAIDLIEGFIAKGKLEDEALKADSEIRGAVSKQLEAINNQAIKDKEKKKENLKIYRDSLRENLNKFDLSDHYKRKILDTATKEDESGNFALDAVYYEMRNNPEKAAELLLFLTDKEEYKKQITKEEVRGTQLDTLKKLKLVTKGGKDSNIKITNKGTAPKVNKDLIDINEIFGN